MPHDVDFGVLLALAYSAFVDEMREELEAAGHAALNRSFGYVARALAETPLTVRELAERLDLTSQGALKIVDDMEANGYLERTVDTTDARARRLHLTRRGKAALTAARAFHRRFEARLGAALGERQAAACRAALEAMVKRREVTGSPPALRPV